MHMSYWFGTEFEEFIFKGYSVTTTWGLIATCLGLGSLAVIFEGLKIVQMKLRLMTIASLPSEDDRPTNFSGESSSLLSRLSSRHFSRSANSTHCVSWAAWILEVIHWSAHTTLGYFLMLAVMTFNGYLSIALAIGGGLGYWIFGPALQELNMLRFNDKKNDLRCDPECSDSITINNDRRHSTVSIIAEQIAAEVNVEVHT